MNAELEPSQRDYYESKHPQCPNCGRYNPKRRNRYVVPQTGSRVRNKEVGCLETFVVFVAGFFVSVIVFAIVSNILGLGTDPLNADGLAFGGILFGFFGGIITITLYVLIQSRSHKTNMTVTHCICRYCKKEWDAAR